MGLCGMTKAEREYLNKLAKEFGCVVCKKFYNVFTEACIHHIRSGMGMGQRNSTDNCLPLCHQHHQGGYGVGFHGGKKIWEEKFGTEFELKQWMEERL